MLGKNRLNYWCPDTC